ncbi:MAG: Ig-like domain-containing protein, partial [Muribaculaceae bacterium]|nr:Ig-like domain-containing protein [Muribaculaceae bacterium]
MRKLVILLFALVMGFGSINAASGIDWSTIGWAGSSVPQYNNNWKMWLPDGLSLVNIQHPGFAEEDGFYVTCPDAAFGELRTDGVKLNYAVQGAGIVLYVSNFTLKETQVDIMNMDNTAVRWTLYVYKNDGQEAGPVAVEGVSLPETAAVYVGRTVTLTPTFIPANATNKNVTWSSSVQSVAT